MLRKWCKECHREWSDTAEGESKRHRSMAVGIPLGGISVLILAGSAVAGTFATGLSAVAGVLTALGPVAALYVHLRSREDVRWYLEDGRARALDAGVEPPAFVLPPLPDDGEQATETSSGEH